MNTENNSMNFERIVENLFLNQPHQTINYYAGIYNSDLLKSRALLFSICFREREVKNKNYTAEQILLLDTFIENLLLASSNISIVSDCINLLISKIEKQTFNS